MSISIKNKEFNTDKSKQYEGILEILAKNAMNMYKGYTKREYNAFISFFIHFYIFMQGTNSVRCNAAKVMKYERFH